MSSVEALRVGDAAVPARGDDRRRARRRAACAGRAPGYVATGAMALSFASAVATLVRAAGPRPRAPPGRRRRLGLREHRRRRRADLAARRPAVGLHDPRRRGRLDADPPLLDRLPGLRPRLHALLLVPELLRLLDAAARPGGQLPAADRRLGVRRRRVVHAHQLLVPAHDGDERGHQGVRHQRARRRRARARDVLHLQARRHAGLPRDASRRPARPSSPATPTSPRAASCCSSARSRSPPRSRCTPGSRTRWRARPPSPP